MSWDRIREKWESDPSFEAAYERDYPFAEIATEVARLRAEHGLTQAQLAEAVGTTQSAISRAESGRQAVSAILLSKIAAAVGCRWRPVFQRAARPTAPAPQMAGLQIYFDYSTITRGARQYPSVVSEWMTNEYDALWGASMPNLQIRWTVDTQMIRHHAVHELPHTYALHVNLGVPQRGAPNAGRLFDDVEIPLASDRQPALALAS